MGLGQTSSFSALHAAMTSQPSPSLQTPHPLLPSIYITRFPLRP